MNKKDKIILFDLDGSMIDSTDAITDTFYTLFQNIILILKELFKI